MTLSMKTIRTTESKVRHLSGKCLGLPWIDEIASVYSTEALTMDWYRHDDAEVICLERGEMSYEISGHGTVTLNAGQLLVIPPRARHRLVAGIDAPSKRVSFKLRRLSGSKSPRPFGGKVYSALRRQLVERAAHTFILTPRAKILELRLGELLHYDRKLSPIEHAEAATIIPLLYIDCATAVARKSPPSVKTVIGEAQRYLQKHLAEKVSMRTLVAHIGYGRSRFFELFKAETGLSPNDYLMRLRIEQARKMLKDPAVSVQDAAAAVGFSDAGYFSRVFKRLSSYSPSVR